MLLVILTDDISLVWEGGLGWDGMGEMGGFIPLPRGYGFMGVYHPLLTRSKFVFSTYDMKLKLHRQ